MAKRVYRTSQGKSIDLGALQLQNETVRAVGNMGVNARGDVVNPQNVTVETKNQKVGRQYKKQVRNNVTDEMPPVSKTKQQKAQAPAGKKVEKTKVEKPKVEKVAKEVDEIIPAVEEVVESEPVIEPVTEPAPVAKSEPTLSGLAGAIAKAKSVKQEPMKTPRQLRQEASGVKKI